MSAFLFMAYLYILYSEKLNKFYVGACINLERRFYEHNIGHSTYTSTGMPWILMYSAQFPDLPTAKKRERQIKSMKSRKYIEQLIATQG
jgi:putative endonuclease